MGETGPGPPHLMEEPDRQSLRSLQGEASRRCQEAKLSPEKNREGYWVALDEKIWRESHIVTQSRVSKVRMRTEYTQIRELRGHGQR